MVLHHQTWVGIHHALRALTAQLSQCLKCDQDSIEWHPIRRGLKISVATTETSRIASLQAIGCGWYLWIYGCMHFFTYNFRCTRFIISNNTWCAVTMLDDTLVMKVSISFDVLPIFFEATSWQLHFQRYEMCAPISKTVWGGSRLFSSSDWCTSATLKKLSTEVTCPNSILQRYRPCIHSSNILEFVYLSENSLKVNMFKIFLPISSTRRLLHKVVKLASACTNQNECLQFQIIVPIKHLCEKKRFRQGYKTIFQCTISGLRSTCMLETRMSSVPFWLQCPLMSKMPITAFVL